MASVEEQPASYLRQKLIERNAQQAAMRVIALKKADKKASLLSKALKIRKLEFNSKIVKTLKQKHDTDCKLRTKGFMVPLPVPKVLFVVRIRGINKLPPKPKMILRLFRLLQINNGVFLKVNTATMEMLKCILPYVTYGPPTLKTIRTLIYKRGYGKIGKRGSRQRVRLTDNSIVEQQLSQYGIHGIDDIVNEIFSCGEHFKQANNFLWPFKLSNPRKGFKAKRHGFSEWTGGEWGDRGAMINNLVSRMN